MSAGFQRTLFQTWGGSLSRSADSGAPRPASRAEAEAQEQVEREEERRAARVWIYPTNYPLREYQLKISGAALFHNTLVCLPTGLGKTFIASVVMYNFYRWYPSGRIVFMAPTKPLVAQQIEACFRVMGIPQDHMAELTGSTQARSRRDLWRSRRVFFLTPQVMVNDLSRQTCPADQVKCVVIDEAHKALGNHAYCQVVKELAKQTRQFRVLALSATPGGDIKAVQQVISNLLISHIELRSEESPDIQAHCHQRSLEKIVVPLGDSLASYQARYLQVLEKFMGRLTQMGVLPKRDLRFLTKYQLILAREQFRSNPHPHIVGAHQGVLEGDFALCISLCHGYELLLQMGLRSLFLFTQSIMDGTKEMARARNELQRTKPFMDLYHELEALFSKPSAGADVPFVYGHPKLQKLEEVVLQHFQTTRVMIFSSFRESVQEIAAMLNRHAPLIRVMTFMGQASAGKGVRGFTQKEQLEVVRRFRDGGFNTLVSTCVGEEGLDIGEVDLIVCFDAQKSPIRLVQRMGRTGRRRQGRIVVILAEGREERTYNQSQSNKRSVYKSIMGKQHTFHMYPNSPRMLPDWARPTLHKMFITCGQFEPQDMRRRSSRGGRLGSVREDGFLTPSEFSLWASTMRLDEEEPQPTLGHSDFLSFKSDREVGRLVRELSLGEWRCWQNRSFPTYRIEHSNRCQHFIEIMALLDSISSESFKHWLPPFFVHHCVSRSLQVAASPGRQFLDDEAELSEQDGSISPDEGEGDELAGSLDGFVVDTSHLSQGLNDSEMHGIYLNSVKSPALLNKYKMLYKPTHNLDIFSQVPEQDETYKEDSFVVQVSDVEDLERGEEEEEEEIREIELLPEESFIGDRRVYPTRRWAQLRQARAAEGHKEAHPKSSSKPKRSRIIRIDDSSEEEDEGKRRRVIGEGSPAPCRPLDKPEEQPFQTPQMVPPSGLGKVAARLKELEGPSLLERCHQRLHIHSSVSEVLDFLPSTPSPTRRAEPQLEAQARCSNSFLNQSAQIQRPVGGTVSGQPLPVSVLVDSRCVAGGPELVSLLRLRHGMRVQVCSLNSCHFIVSNRMAVERQPQSEVASSLNRKRLADRVQGLQGLFDRVCLIIEKDRIKPGDASRPFQQSRYYDSTLALLLQAGVRLLFSDGPEETAALLAELAHLEQRKGQAVSVPTEVTGYQQQSLHFYLTLPCVSYVTALNMCHGFRSLGHLVDSSLEALMSGACVSRRRAEEIFRCLHYPCDVNMLPDAAACRKHSP
uniref:FA complementation group M n=1 Tax=Scleropages formosus TaxID=113540 RepID=A0A8C9W7I0_SCLFO